MNRIKRILMSLIVVASVSTVAILGTTAYFSDTETSTGNVLSAGSIDLQIDNKSYYNGVLQDGSGGTPNTSWELDDLTEQLFFNFTDLKPGDWGEDTISFHVDDNPAWVCAETVLTSNDDVSSTEPELDVDEEEDPDDFFDGELAEELQFVFWRDDGDNVFELHEQDDIIIQGSGLEVLNSKFAIADSTVGDPLDTETDSPYYIAKAWCLGELALTPVSEGTSPADDPGITCNGASATNRSQTDSLTADFVFTAIQSRHNDGFRCVACENPFLGYADSVFSYFLGETKSGDPISDDRDDPESALGAPDDDFVSLGFGGEIILDLGGTVDGSSVTSIEVTYGRENYPEETADLYVSEDNVDWKLAGPVSNHDNTDGRSVVSVLGLGMDEIRFVKLIDTTDESIHAGDADGYDLDAIEVTLCPIEE
ncbi:MAG: SipW-dependent-type signal peptide-containing protein [Patescibacteria group bacterium]